MKTIKKGKLIKNQLAIAVTAALLALPLSSPLALAETTTPATTTSVTATTDTTSADSTSTDDTTSTNANTDNTDSGTTNSADEDIDNEDTDSTSVVDNEGNEIEPANWLSDLIGKLQMALTFDPAGKSKLNQEQALAKLAKAQKLIAEGKTEESETAFSEYADKITKAQEFLEQVEDPDSEEAENLALALTNVNQNNIKVLSNLLEKLPPQAAQRLALNVVRSMEKAVTKMEKQEADTDAASAPEAGLETAGDSTDPVVTASTNKKSLEKQAKEALKEFKKELKQRGKIHLEDDQDVDQEENQAEDDGQDQSQEASLANTQPTSVTIMPAKSQSSNAVDRSSENKQDGKIDNKSGEKKQDSNQHDKQRDDK